MKILQSSIKSVALVACAVSVLAVATPTMAKPDSKGGKRGHMSKSFNPQAIFKKLDISEEQKQQLEAINAESKQQMMALKEQKAANLEEDRPSFMDGLQAPQFDQTAFELAYEKKSAARKEFELIAAKRMHASFQVLNAEQKAKFIQMVEERKLKLQNKKQQRKKNKGENNSDSESVI